MLKVPKSKLSVRTITDPTLADVALAIANASALPPFRRRDLRSAILSYCSLIREVPERVALDIPTIGKTLSAMNAPALGISTKRLANIRSDLIAAIRASRLKPVLLKPRGDLPQSWRNIVASLAFKSHRIGLSRLARYAAELGLAPRQINDDVITGFMDAVRTGSLHRKPNDLHRQVTSIWNEVARLYPELKLPAVTIASYRAPPRRIGWSTLPDSFRKDVDTYLTWCLCTDPFDENARARPLAQSTVRLRRDQIHAAATALAEAGWGPSQLKSLGNLVDPDSFKAILRHRLKIEKSASVSFNHGLATTLIQAAREWVKVEPATLAELRRLASKLPPLPVDLALKNKRFLLQFDDPAAMQRLMNLPTQLWSRVKRDKAPNFKTLANAQVAIGVAMLTYLPVRIQNLGRLAFDRHVFLQKAPGAISTLQIPAEEVKNGLSIEFDIPAHIAAMLMEYRDVLVPKILGQKTARLFVNEDGSAKRAQTLSHLIRRATRREAGLELSPHQFRHLAAKVILDHSPGAFELVKQVLGHRNIKTTANFYAGIDTRRAARHHFSLLQAEINETKALSSARSRRRKR